MAAGGGDLRAPPRRGVGGAGLEIGQILDRPPGERLVAGAGDEELGPGNDVGDAGVVLGRRADVEIDPERSGDLFGGELAERLPRDPPHQLAFEVALCQRVVARRRPRLPPGLLGGKDRRRPLPVVQPLDGQRFRPSRQAGCVAHHVADLDLALAARLELGPVAPTGA